MIAIEQYLRTSYRPELDYVDGELLDRNGGLYDHSRTLGAFLFYLHELLNPRGAWALPTLRIRVSATRVRVPDVCVFLADPEEQVPTKPPFLCIEVLSREDRMSRIQEKVEDYLAMGVSYVWVVDPATKCAWTITRAEGWREEKGGLLRTANPDIEVPLSEIFSA